MTNNVVSPGSAPPTVPATVTTTKTENRSFLGGLSVPGKLSLLTLSLGIPFLIALGAIGNNYYSNLQHARHSAQVSKLLTPAQDLQRLVRVIRPKATIIVSPEQIAELRSLSKSMSNIAQTTAEPKLVNAVSGLTKSLDDMANGLEAKTYTRDALYKATSDYLNGDGLRIFTTIADSGNLMNNNSLERTKLTQLAVVTLPRMLPRLGSYNSAIQKITIDAINKQKGVLTDAQRELANAQLTAARNDLDSLESDINEVLAYPAVEAALGDKLTKIVSVTRGVFDFNETNGIQPAKITTAPDEFTSRARTYTTSQYAGFKAASNYLAKGYAQQQHQANQQLLVSLALAALTLLAAYLLVRAITNALLRPLNNLTAASQRLSQGDFTATVPVTSQDELGTLSRTFNAASAQLKQSSERNEVERLEAQKLQEHVGEFLNVTMDIADGDLTKRGKVTEDVLGNVVDSINLMTDELAGTLKGVQTASQSVASGSQAMLNTTAQIEQGSVTTTEQARRLAEQAREVNVQIQEMARLAQTSSETARRALAAAQQGESAVGTTLQGMQAIRDSSLSVVQRVDSLAKRSEEIQDIVDSISNISSQTNLLALHASLEAAGAGEAGGRFAVVADEIRQLADEASSATARVTNLLSSVQSDIQEVNTSMQQSFAQVQSGYQQAEQAGNSLRQIGTLSQDSAQLADQISGATQAQVQNVGSMGQGVQEIAEIAAQAQQSVQQGRSAAEQLQQLAQQLTASLNRFRLPS